MAKRPKTSRSVTPLPDNPADADMVASQGARPAGAVRPQHVRPSGSPAQWGDWERADDRINEEVCASAHRGAGYRRRQHRGDGQRRHPDVGRDSPLNMRTSGSAKSWSGRRRVCGSPSINCASQNRSEASNGSREAARARHRQRRLYRDGARTRAGVRISRRRPRQRAGTAIVHACGLRRMRPDKRRQRPQCARDRAPAPRPARGKLRTSRGALRFFRRAQPALPDVDGGRNAAPASRPGELRRRAVHLLEHPHRHEAGRGRSGGHHRVVSNRSRVGLPALETGSRESDPRGARPDSGGDPARGRRIRRGHPRRPHRAADAPHLREAVRELLLPGRRDARSGIRASRRPDRLHPADDRAPASAGRTRCSSSPSRT